MTNTQSSSGIQLQASTPSLATTVAAVVTPADQPSASTQGTATVAASNPPPDFVSNSPFDGLTFQQMRTALGSNNPAPQPSITTNATLTPADQGEGGGQLRQGAAAQAWTAWSSSLAAAKVSIPIANPTLDRRSGVFGGTINSAPAFAPTQAVTQANAGSIVSQGLGTSVNNNSLPRFPNNVFGVPAPVTTASAPVPAWGAVSGSCFGSAPNHHDEFYFHDGNALLKAGDVLFRVHWSILTRHSQHFVHMANAPSVAQTVPHMTSVEFARLLTVLYHPIPAKVSTWSAEDWVSVIGLAQRWDMQHIKECAVQKLCSLEMDPITKIAFWHKYQLDSTQLIPAYAALCIAEQPLSVEVLGKIGSDAFVKVVEAREKFRTAVSTAGKGIVIVGKIRSALAEQVVESVFFPPPTRF
ncbi:hypothetical protein HYDPIDRAFT_27182 [Hydnomerulius pinastri MD-312]|nr:hypothetical protein HYDPIDRAFT_27182 [Hydnomerulius pinastri MD-312]